MAGLEEGGFHRVARRAHQRRMRTAIGSRVLDIYPREGSAIEPIPGQDSPPGIAMPPQSRTLRKCKNMEMSRNLEEICEIIGRYSLPRGLFV
jgi:hypothetical protein